jgi:hypothetical protein
MPTRKLPHSAKARLKALQTGKIRKDAIPAPAVIPYSAPTMAKLDLVYPVYKLKVEAMETALQAQTSVSGSLKDKTQMAIWLISDFFSALQSAIRRKKFEPSVRAFYGLAVSDDKIPRIKAEADITFWGDKAATGEAARIAAGGSPISFPTIAEVTTAVTDFTTPNQAQEDAKFAYDSAQEAVEAENPEVDKLILKMWNETETAFDEGNKPSMRRKARQWGVVYVPNAGEAPSPDEFSIIGKVTDSATGLPLSDAAVMLPATGLIVLTDAQGNYFIEVQPPGAYDIEAYKIGYQPKEAKAVAVTAGQITTQNFVLEATTGVGEVKGTITEAGVGTAATVTVDGTSLTTTTDSNGTYSIPNVPIGNQTIRATLTANPASVQTQAINVTDGDTVYVDFDF